MDPCPFVRLMVESLALKLHTTTNTTTKYFAKLKLTNFPSQTTLLPVTAAPLPDSSETAAASFHLDPDALRGLNSKPSSLLTLKLSVYAGKQSKGLMSTCASARGKLLGSVQVCVSLGAGGQSKARVYHSGWMKLSGGSGGVEPVAKLHATVRSEPDPRYMFQFGGEPECSPVVFQIQGNNIRQPVFSCKFTADRSYNNRSRSLPSDFNNNINKQSWLRRTFSSDKEHDATTSRRDRKGWMVTIYDLSGSAVAAASMITPFVPSPNSDFVSRSNPGSWLVLRPSSFGWKPWGRLEAWREKGKKKNDSSMGYKFDLLIDDSNATVGGVGIPIAEGKMSFRKGGDFRIDGSYYNVVRGFVMGTDIGGEGGNEEEAVTVQVGARYVADAALFVALSAAVDLSMDACRVF